jgi:CubicO group peptidase (beta-lactamase class C family)
MTRSTFRPTVALTYPLAHGHDGDPPRVVRPIANNAAAWAAGSLFSNALELAQFMRACLADGQLDGQQVLAPALIRRLLTPAVPVAVPPLIGAEATFYTYGLARCNYGGVELVCHSGGRLGHGSFLVLAPRERIGIVVLANKSAQALTSVVAAALDLLLALPERHAHEERRAATDSEAQNANLAGEYWHGPHERLHITAQPGALLLNANGATHHLQQSAAGRYKVVGRRGADPHELAVVRRSDGTVGYLLKDWRIFLPVEA